MSEINDKSVLLQVKTFLKRNYKKGCTCPACGQNVKLYRRKLNSSMAYGLIILYRLHKEKGFDKGIKMNTEVAKLKIPSSNIEYSKLAYWGLIEEEENTDKTKKNSGMWKITTHGKKFVNKEVSIPKYVFIYNGIVKGFSEDKTTISNSLGDKFNYTELMNNK